MRFAVTTLQFAAILALLGTSPTTTTTHAEVGQSAIEDSLVGRGAVSSADVEDALSYSPYTIDVGELQGSVGSMGQFGPLIYPVGESSVPRLKKVYYSSYCGLFVSGIRWIDTICSGQGYWPNDQLLETVPPHKTSNIRRHPAYDPLATLGLEIRQTLCDTGLGLWNLDEVDGDTLPDLGLLVRQSVIASDFLKRSIIVDCHIINTSDEILSNVCIGINITSGSYNEYISRMREVIDGPVTGTICGFVPVVPGIVPSTEDSLKLAWYADNDGDAAWTKGKFGVINPTAAIGLRVLNAPKGGRLSYNWWDYFTGRGPRQMENVARDPDERGWPPSDRAYQRLMTNGEIDFDIAFSGIDHSDFGWQRMGSLGVQLSNGSHLLETMLSVGPFDSPLYAGDSIRFTYAIVIGKDFHIDPNHFVNSWNHTDPAPYLNGLNFTNLISAAQWAGWFFDNPGVDTDGDGYAGEFYLVDCNGRDCDSVYYSGDGVPDFKGPLPPPPPDDITFETFPTKIIARWTGKATEFARDRHMRRPDWEGYKVYLAVDDTVKGWSLVGSWDRQDYVRYSYHDVKETWIRNSQPHTIEEWRQILSDPEFDPRDHSMPSFSSAYFDIATDTVRTAAGTIVDIVTHDRWSYFGHEAADHQNEYEDNGRMHPNPIQLVGTVDTLIDGEIQQYGVYEYTIDDLSQSKVYWITVSAFDYGDYRNFIDPEESAPGENAVRFVPVNSADVVVDSNLKVNVHPNPYKSEFYDNQGNVATYHSQGYEYSPSGKFDERDRRIWFTNLPDTAVIEIYSLDGDLIRIIRHPDDFLTKYQSVVGWDLISRNTQAVTAGIYIWKVSSRLGSQVGKLVIIK